MALPYVEMTGVSAVGIDWTFERSIARDTLQPRVPVQGNIDPLALLAGGAALDREVDDVMKELGGGPLIFNLGHGILPATPIAQCRAHAQTRAWMMAMYLWFKALHIIGVITWMAGMLYLPRLFVYHAGRKAWIRTVRNVQDDGTPAA